MLKTILVHGTLAGALVAGQFVALFALNKGEPPPTWGAIVGYATMLLAFSLIFLAIKRRRDVAQGGVIRFLPALGLGLGISLVATMIYAVTWEAVLATTGMDFAGDYAAQVLEQKRAAGASAAELAEQAEKLAKFVRDYANPLYRVPMTMAEIFPVGLLVSLVSAGLLSNSRFMPARRAAPAA
jgi:hypothetical protein